jgi:hypothetical protein
MKKTALLLVGLMFFILVGCQKKENQISQSIDEAVDATTGLGYINVEKKAVKDIAIAQTQTLCRQKLAAGEDLSMSPCLGVVAPDWVGDVAHNPRSEIDNLPENQCSDFREGKAHHFVEVDPNCNFIKAY